MFRTSWDKFRHRRKVVRKLLSKHKQPSRKKHHTAEASSTLHTQTRTGQIPTRASSDFWYRDRWWLMLTKLATSVSHARPSSPATSTLLLWPCFPTTSLSEEIWYIQIRSHVPCQWNGLSYAVCEVTAKICVHTHCRLDKEVNSSWFTCGYGQCCRNDLIHQ